MENFVHGCVAVERVNASDELLQEFGQIHRMKHPVIISNYANAGDNVQQWSCRGKGLGRSGELWVYPCFWCASWVGIQIFDSLENDTRLSSGMQAGMAYYASDKTIRCPKVS